MVGIELDLGQLPDQPLQAESLVIVPVGSISKVTQLALRAALSLGDDVVAVSVYPEAEERAAFRAEWDRWSPGVRLDILDSPHRSLVHPVVDYVRHHPLPAHDALASAAAGWVSLPTVLRWRIAWAYDPSRVASW
jgi:hypothetical protein